MATFPKITSINDVLPYVEDHPNFVVIHGDCGNSYVDYVVQGDDTFPPLIDHPAAIRRECRGIAFHRESGDTVSRPFHKFFNLGERPETLFEALSWNRPYHAQVKMDGSMVRPVPVDDDHGYPWRMATRKGITDTACAAEMHTAQHDVGDYDMMFDYFHRAGYSPIFEWCSPRNRIVLKYDEPQLVLLAARKIITGEYISYQILRNTADNYEIPVVPLYDMSDPAAAVQALRAMEGMEGVVIVFEDGTRVKVKSDWYAQLHRVKSSLTRERDVIGMALENRVDDVLQLLTPDMRAELLDFQNRVIDVLGQYGADVRRQRAHLTTRWTRKEFAQSQVAADMDPLRKGIIFATWDGDDNLDSVIRSVVRRHLMSNRMYRRLKDDVLRDLPSWSEIDMGDEA